MSNLDQPIHWNSSRPIRGTKLKTTIFKTTSLVNIIHSVNSIWFNHCPINKAIKIKDNCVQLMSSITVLRLFKIVLIVMWPMSEESILTSKKKEKPPPLYLTYTSWQIHSIFKLHLLTKKPFNKFKKKCSLQTKTSRILLNLSIDNIQGIKQEYCGVKLKLKNNIQDVKLPNLQEDNSITLRILKLKNKNQS